MGLAPYPPAPGPWSVVGPVTFNFVGNLTYINAFQHASAVYYSVDGGAWTLLQSFANFDWTVSWTSPAGLHTVDFYFYSAYGPTNWGTSSLSIIPQSSTSTSDTWLAALRDDGDFGQYSISFTLDRTTNAWDGTKKGTIPPPTFTGHEGGPWTFLQPVVFTYNVSSGYGGGDPNWEWIFVSTNGGSWIPVDTISNGNNPTVLHGTWTGPSGVGYDVDFLTLSASPSSTFPNNFAQFDTAQAGNTMSVTPASYSNLINVKLLMGNTHGSAQDTYVSWQYQTNGWVVGRIGT